MVILFMVIIRTTDTIRIPDIVITGRMDTMVTMVDIAVGTMGIEVTTAGIRAFKNRIIRVTVVVRM
jgi:hypothetical protein